MLRISSNKTTLELTTETYGGQKQRLFCFDNLKALLIIFVVLGHLLEICPFFNGKSFIYRIIYSFHMPAFVFLSGYFAKFNPKRIIIGYAMPYVVFQTLFILFSRVVLENEIRYQLTTPHFSLWYLLACVFYQMIIPFFDTDNKKKQIINVMVTVILALLVGFESTIGKYATLSRFFVFQPWFLLGFYCRKNDFLKRLSSKTKIILSVIFVGVIALYSVTLLRKPLITNGLLYGSTPYTDMLISPIMRLCIMLVALCWVGLLLIVFTKFFNVKIPLLTTVGQNTLPVYLLHAYVIKFIPKYCPNVCNGPILVILVTCVTVLLFGNKFIGLFFKWLFGDLRIKK